MNNALEKAIDAAGSLTELANRLGVQPQVIVNWRKRQVPAQRVLDVERATVERDQDGNPKDGETPRVTRFDLRPDLYPPEERVAA